MKRSLFILILLSAVLKLNSQSFQVGQTTCNYNVVNQTYTISCPYYSSASQTSTIDIDGDAQTDILVSTSCWSWPSSNIGNAISVSSPNSTCQFVKNPVTTAYTTVANLSFGSVIAANSNWVPSGDLYSYHWIATNGVASGTQVNPFYVGFKKIVGNDTIYGWIRMSSINAGTLYDYAYKRTPSVTPNPVFTNTVTSICPGNSLTLTSNPVNAWFTGVGVSGNIFTSNVPGNYQVYCSNGCQNTGTLNLTVNPLPNTVFTNTETAVCLGDTLILTGSPAGGVFSGTGVSSNVFHSSFTGLGNTNIYYTSTNSFGCSKTATLNLGVTFLNVVASKTVMCVGDVATFSLSGASTYTISGGGSSIVTTSPSVIITPTVSGTYTITSFPKANGCSNTATISMLVNPLPPTAFTNTMTSICMGDSIILNGTPSGGSYIGGGVTSNGVFHSTLAAVGNNQVYYSYTNGNGCSKTATLNITVSPLPSLSVTSSYSPSCANQIVSISASGASTYSWSSGSTVPTITVNPASTTNYTVTGFSSAGCASSKVFTQTVGNPTISVNVATNSTLACSGQPVVLTAFGATNYTWSTGANTNSITVNPTSSTTYSVIGALTSAGGCSNTASFYQNVGTPTVSVIALNDTICIGQPAYIYGYGNATNYLWNTGNTTLYCFESPTVTTTYSLIGTNAGGCGDTASVQIYVTTQNLVLSATTTNSVICQGNSAFLTLHGGNNYTLQSGNLFFYPADSTITITPSVTTTYTITTPTYIGGCQTIGFFTQNVSPLPTPVFTNTQSIVCVGDSMVLTYTPTGGILGGNYLSGSVFKPTSAGTQTIFYTYTNSYGCSGSTTKTITVSSCVGINELNLQNNSFSIYPNPNNGEFEIKGTKEQTIFVSNELGQIIGTKELNSENNYSTKIAGLKNGVYFVGQQKIIVIR